MTDHTSFKLRKMNTAHSLLNKMGLSVTTLMRLSKLKDSYIDSFLEELFHEMIMVRHILSMDEDLLELATTYLQRRMPDIVIDESVKNVRLLSRNRDFMHFFGVRYDIPICGCFPVNNDRIVLTSMDAEDGSIDIYGHYILGETEEQEATFQFTINKDNIEIGNEIFDDVLDILGTDFKTESSDMDTVTIPTTLKYSNGQLRTLSHHKGTSLITLPDVGSSFNYFMARTKSLFLSPFKTSTIDDIVKYIIGNIIEDVMIYELEEIEE